ncbi:MAG TPA: hypothetical protein VJ768_03565 [Anaerolineales bacterium]|nr:hypothetical protein [Anaerolineales bacterium]
MRIVSNDRLIKRNARIGQISSVAGLAVLGGGLLVSFQAPEQFALSWGALLVGFILSQIGLYFSNRWGRSPRPDEELTKALKGLSQEYTLYHYSSPARHLLLGPAGLWVLAAYRQNGQISYINGKWKHTAASRGFLLRRWFGQEGLGRPDLEIGGEIDAIKKFLDKTLSEEEQPGIQAALVFTGKEVALEAETSPVPAVLAKKLKALIQRQTKEHRISLELKEQIQGLLEA